MTSNPQLSPVAEAAVKRIQFIHWVDHEIDRFTPGLEKALSCGMPDGVRTHNMADLKSMIINNEAQMWSTENGVCICTMSVYPQSSTYEIWLMAGDFDELMTKWFATVQDYARQCGASLMYVRGRKGWTRRLLSRGFKQGHSTTCLDLREHNGTTIQ